MYTVPSFDMCLSLAQMPLAFNKAWWTVAESMCRPVLPKPIEHARFDAIPEAFAATSVQRPTSSNVVDFARASGDTNPLHFDDSFARGTMFKSKIVHGILTASYVSALFAEHFPGAAFIETNFKYLKPVRVGDEVTARIVVTDRNELRRRVTFDCGCSVGPVQVLSGTAVLMMPR